MPWTCKCGWDKNPDGRPWCICGLENVSETWRCVPCEAVNVVAATCCSRCATPRPNQYRCICGHTLAIHRDAVALERDRRCMDRHCPCEEFQPDIPDAGYIKDRLAKISEEARRQREWIEPF